MLQLSSNYAKTYLKDIHASNEYKRQIVAQQKSHYSEQSLKIKNNIRTKLSEQHAQLSQREVRGINGKQYKQNYMNNFQISPSNDNMEILNYRQKDKFKYRTSQPKDSSILHQKRNQQIKGWIAHKPESQGYDNIKQQKEYLYRQKNVNYGKQTDEKYTEVERSFNQQKNSLSQKKNTFVLKTVSSLDSCIQSNMKHMNLSRNDFKDFCSFRELQITPRKRNQIENFTPGSAERKQSLIQKSQMLQQKLHKISSQRSGNTYNAELREKYQENIRLTSLDCNKYENYGVYNQTNKRNLRVNQQKQVGLQMGSSLKQNRYSHQDNIPSYSNQQKIISSTSIHQKSTIGKIASLNEKINERIQSIIKNYTTK